MAVPFHLNEDGFESHLAVNYLGHFLLTHLLMPQLRAGGRRSLKARIINVASCAHLSGEINMDDINGTWVQIYGPLFHIQNLISIFSHSFTSNFWIYRENYSPIKAYCQSKLALVLFTLQLQRMFDKAKNFHVQVHGVHPGIIDTEHHVSMNISYFPLLMKLAFKVIIAPFICS